MKDACGVACTCVVCTCAHVLRYACCICICVCIQMDNVLDLDPLFISYSGQVWKGIISDWVVQGTLNSLYVINNSECIVFINCISAP